MTESTAVGTRGYNTVDVRNYSSVGLLSPNVEAKVIDWSTGSHLPPGSVGELWLHTPGNMKGNVLNSNEFYVHCCKSCIKISFMDSYLIIFLT